MVATKNDITYWVFEISLNREIIAFASFRGPILHKHKQQLAASIQKARIANRRPGTTLIPLTDKPETNCRVALPAPSQIVRVKPPSGVRVVPVM